MTGKTQLTMIKRSGAIVFAILLITSVISSGSVGLIGTANAAGSTDLTVSPPSQTLEPSETTTVEIAVASANGGVGSAEFRIELSDPSVASIQDISVGNNPGADETEIDSDGNGVDVKYAFDDTQDQGSVTVATLTFEAESAGTTDIEVTSNTDGTLVVSDEAGETYDFATIESGSFTVDGGSAAFDVSIGSTNSPIEAGNTLEVTATIENTGEQAGTQRISLDVPGIGSTETDVQLDAGEASQQTLSIATAQDDGGSYTAEVASEADSDTVSVEVNTDSGFITGDVSNPVGDPLPEASVTIEDSSGSVIEEVTTNDEGRYTVEVSPGEYTVIAELEGYETTSSTETVEPSETTSANLPLSPSDPPEDPGSISGRVTDQNDNSLSGSSVTVEDSSGSIITKTTTGDNGQYTIEDVSPGEYTVIAEFDNKEGRAIANVESSTTKYASIVIVLDRDTPTGAITGDIISSDSNPIAGAEVKIINADTNEVVESVNTGSKGSYVFPKIEANKEYKIEASDEGYDTNSTSIINSEGTDNQDIVLTETDQETGGVKISTDAPGTVTSGNEVEVTITLTNTGSTASDSGSLEVIVPDRLSLVDVTGDGVSQPDRFYLDPISPGDSVSTTYTFKAPEDTSTGTVSLDTTGSIQIDDESYSASTTSDIEISDRGTGDVEISTDTLGTVAPGEEVEVTITTTNTGSATAGAGGLEVTVPDRLSLVDVTGDGQNQPDRFYIDSIPSGDSVSTTYTLRAPEDASTGTVNFDVTGTLTFDDGSRSASTTTEIEISEGGLPTDPGEPEFIDVLQVIDAYNTEDAYNGVQIEFIDVLEVISAYNAG